MDATVTSLAEDLQDLQLDRPTAGLKSTEELDKLTVDEHLSDIERAVYLLSSGQEVQRISVINNLPDLLRDTESHDECMRRVVPKVREVLHVAQTEMQLAASSAFLQILQKNLVPIQNYSQTFLQTILNSVDSKDPDVANAWLDTLLDVIDLLPKDVIRKEILSVAVAKGQLSQSVQARMACCKILGKVSTKFEPFVIKKEILPVVQSLCQDVDYEVRGCMCRQLDSVSRGLGLEATKSAILPELVELTNDEESYVRIAGLETVVNILSLLDTETCCSTIIPLVCKICQQALQSEDATLPVVSKQFGKLCHGLSEHLTDEQKQWFVDFYKKLCKVGLAAERNKASTKAQIPVETKAKENQSKDTDLPDLFELEDKLIESRKNGAFNFPAMVLFTGAKQFKSELLGTFSSLCKDPHITVRKSVSSGYHEVCKLLGNSIQLLQPDLILLLKDDSIEVLRGVISNIPVIIDCHLGGGSNHAISEAKSNSLSDVIPALLASEAVIFSSNNWRLQQELMENMSCLLKCCSSETLYQKVIPLLFQKIKAARALPVKLAASKSAILISRKLKKLEQREELFHQLVTDFCHARSCYQRGLFIDICKIVIDVYSKKFFKEHYFEYVLELHTDSVPNIRLRLCSILPELKRLLKLPTDRSLLQLLDMCIRKLLVAEKDRDVQNAVKAAVDELDKIHIQMESLTRRNFFEQDMADQKKEEEERVMIENEEKEAKKEEEQAEKKSKGDKRNAASAKKGENGSSKIPAPRKGSKAGVAGGSSGSSNQTSSKKWTPQFIYPSHILPEVKETTVSRSNESAANSTNNKMVKSKSTNTLSLIPRRDNQGSRIPLKPKNQLSTPDSSNSSDENTKITEAKQKTKLPKATQKASQGQSSGIKSPSIKTNTIKMAGDKPSSPKLSRLPLYSSQPNLHNGRPTSPSLIPVKATTSSINKSSTSKTAARAGGPAAPGSAGTRRGSNPSIPAQRRGSLTTASSSTSEASSVKSTKGSNGSLPPSSKSRKKSK